MSKYVKFRLTTEKKEGTWSMKGGRALKNGNLKSINYYPGSDSIFDEDNKDNVIKPKTVVFRYNDILSDPAVEIIVPLADKNLLEYLRKHPLNGRLYKEYSENQAAQEKLDSFNNIEKALEYIKESNNMKLKGIALAVLGYDFLSFDSIQLQTILKEMALKEPEKINSVVESQNYQNRLTAGQAFASEVVKCNPTNTAVVWADNGGIIVHVAKGENPIEKLSDFFLNSKTEAITVLQEIGDRMSAKIKMPSNQEDVASKVSAEKDKEIEALRKELEATKAKQTVGTTDNTGDDTGAITDDDSGADETTIEELRAEYEKKFEKDVPNRYKNDRTWIEAELAKQ